MPSPMTSSATGRPSPPLSSTSISIPLALIFMVPASDEFAFAQPLGRDPLFAGQHGRTAVQGPGRGVGLVVAEEDAGAALGRDLEADVGEGRAAALSGFLQVHHQGG